MSSTPQAHDNFMDHFPEVAAAYTQLGAAVHQAGPLDEKTRQLAKLAMAIGARQEGAVHAHTRRALDVGCTMAEIQHIVALAATTLGMPNAVAAFTWVNDVLNPGK